MTPAHRHVRPAAVSGGAEPLPIGRENGAENRLIEAEGAQRLARREVADDVRARGVAVGQQPRADRGGQRAAGDGLFLPRGQVDADDHLRAIPVAVNELAGQGLVDLPPGQAQGELYLLPCEADAPVVVLAGDGFQLVELQQVGVAIRSLQEQMVRLGIDGDLMVVRRGIAGGDALDVGPVPAASPAEGDLARLDELESALASNISDVSPASPPSSNAPAMVKTLGAADPDPVVAPVAPDATEFAAAKEDYYPTAKKRPGRHT